MKSKTAPDATLWWLGLAAAAFCLLPWYWIDLPQGLLLAGWPLGASGSALALGLAGGKPWLLLMLAPLLLGFAALNSRLPRETRGLVLVWAGVIGLPLFSRKAF